MHPFRLIAMNAGKYPEPDRIVATLWADEQVARQFIALSAARKLSAMIRYQARRPRRNAFQWRQ